MMTIALLVSLYTPWPAPSPTWPRPPILHFVPGRDQWLLMENGVPAQAIRRSRVELLKAAWSN